MRSVHGLAALGLFALLAGCQRAGQDAGSANTASETMSASDRAADEQALRDHDTQMLAAAQTKDAAAVAAFFAPGARFMAPNAPTAEGPASIQQAWAGTLQLPGVALSWTRTMTHVSDAGDLAYTVGTYTLSYDDPKGRITDNGKYVAVLSKVGGEWKIVADMFNSDLPLPAPAPK